jgi:hypothetical protein
MSYDARALATAGQQWQPMMLRLAMHHTYWTEMPLTIGTNVPVGLDVAG